jgi:hypothetical protein
MYTFEAQIQIDGFTARHVQSLKKQVAIIADAVVTDLEEYHNEEDNYPFGKLVTQGFKFVATFAMARTINAEQLRSKIENDILAYFEGAKEIWVECYCLEPVPPHIDFTITHPKQAERNRKEREKRKADWEKRQAKYKLPKGK